LSSLFFLSFHQVRALLAKLDHLESLYSSWKKVKEDHPQLAEPDLMFRVECLREWISVDERLDGNFQRVVRWIE